jgi:hypothetical protein
MKVDKVDKDDKDDKDEDNMLPALHHTCCP